MFHVPFESFPEILKYVLFKLSQASSDLSILDFDIPFAFVFVAAGVTEVLATIGIMAFITWQVLIVGILAMVAVKYIQVEAFSFHLIFSNLICNQVERANIFGHHTAGILYVFCKGAHKN